MHHAFPTRRSSDLHGKDGKPPYGYTLIDHAAKAVHKGGEVMPLAEFIALEVGTVGRQQPHSSQQEPHAWFQTKPTVDRRSEEHTSELQSLMRISYAVFCLKKQKQTT